mmetsp:Transcript_15679/g.35307  ORF Transcript_15679/g.35307 Transcript_15679/m.35307 type:complete len:105 (-) Transcript_15679:63-377(-)
MKLSINGQLKMDVQNLITPSRTCTYAPTEGHLEILKWARAHGCPWDESTCSLASDGGHLEILKWARAQGCPWDEDTCHFALDRGHKTVYQWAVENGCPEYNQVP